MRGRLISIGIICAALITSTAGVAFARQTIDFGVPFETVGLPDVMESVVSGDNSLVIEIQPPNVFSPFGPDQQDPTGMSTIGDNFDFTLNPRGFGVSGDLDFDGTVDIDVAGDGAVPGSLNRLTPSGPGDLFFDGVPLPPPYPTPGEIPSFGGQAANSVDGLLLGLGVDPNQEGVQDALGTQLSVARPLNPGPPPLNGAITVWGSHFTGSMPPGAPCAGSPYIYEMGRAFLRDGAPPWVPGDFAPMDLFTGASDALVVRCNGGWHVESLSNTGASFQSMTTNTVALVFENGFIAFTPSVEFAGQTAYRSFAFRTPAQGGFQPGNTFATVHPDFPTLMDAHSTVVVGDPYPNSHGPFPLQMQFTASTYEPGSDEASQCGPDWSGLFEANLFESSTPGAKDVALYQFASGQHTLGTVMYGDGGFDLASNGGGDGYTEGFTLQGSSGEYTFMPGGLECSYGVSVTSGLPEFMEFLESMSPPEEVEVVPPVSAASSSSVAPAVDVTPEESLVQDTTDGQAVATGSGGDDDGDGFPWGIASILAGIAFIAGGFFVSRTRGGEDGENGSPTDTPRATSGPPASTTSGSEGPCDRIRRMYEEAKEEADSKRKEADDADTAADDAESEADDARSDADDAQNEANDAERDRRNAERDRNAPEPGDEETYIEDSETGERITLTDIRNRRAAAQEAWDDYQSDPSPESAAQTEADWEALDAEGARGQRRADWEADQAERAEALGDAEAAAQEANDARGEAVEAADAAEQAAKDARAEADRLEEEASEAEAKAAELKRMLDECLDLVSGGTVGLAEDPSGGCFPEGNVERRELDTFDKTVKVNWWVTVRPSSTAREDAERMAGELRWWRDVFGTGSAAINVTGAVSGLTSRTVDDAVSTAVSGASVVAGDATGLDIPTTLPQVPLVVLEGAAATSAALIDKWGELIERNHVEWIAEFGFQVKDVKMTWVEIWKCENGVKSCEERVLEVDMGEVRNTGAVHTETYQPRENWQSRVDGLGRTMARQAQSSSQDMVTFMGKHKAGPCS